MTNVLMQNPNLGNKQISIPDFARNLYQLAGWVYVGDDGASSTTSPVQTSIPAWAPNTPYPASWVVLAPTGQIVSAKVAFTTGSSYNAANWTVVNDTGAGGGGGSGLQLWQPNTAYTAGQQVLSPAGQVVKANTGFTSGAAYDGTNWTVQLDSVYAPANDLRFTTVVSNTQSGTTYTAALADAGRCVEMNNSAANTFTVPPNSSVAFPVGTVIEVCQYGAGQTTIAAGAGVTIRNPSSLTTRAQFSTVTLRQRAANEWVLTGDLT